MKIRNITINSFGKLNNYSLDLSDGVNVVYGPNEYGKTTIMEFIKIMFYGKNEKTATDKLIREKYKPWNGAKMGGSIEFEHDGQIYKVQKEISDKSARNDKTIIQNISTGATVKLGKDEEVGEHFFGIDVKSFERSSYIKNLGACDFEKPKSSKNVKDTLADKMFSNLLGSGEDDVSQSGVISRVKDAMKDLKTPTGRSGKIRKSETEITELKLKINDLNSFEKSQEDIKKELQSLGDLIKEQKALESKIKKFNEYRRAKEIQKLFKIATEREELRKKAAEFGINIDSADEVLNRLENYKKDLDEINIKIENIKNLSKNQSDSSPKISEEEKNCFESLLKQYELAREKNEVLKYLTSDNVFDYELNKFEFSENFKNMGLKIKNSERMTASKTLELENIRSKSKKSNNNFLFVDGLFLLGAIICVFSNLLNFFSVVFGIFLCTAIGHLYCFYKNKRKAEILENVISETNSQIESFKSDFNIEVDKIKSQTQNNLKDTEKEIRDLLSKKMCRNRAEFYQNYAKSQNFEDFSAAFQSSESKRAEILRDLKKFLNSEGIRISADKFYEALDFLRGLKSEYTGVNSEINYKASALNLKNIDLENLKNILKENSCSELDFEISEIDKINSRFAELEKMNLHSTYIETQKKIINTSEDPENLKLCLKNLELKRQKMEEYYRSLEIALGAFEEVSDELRKNFNPKLNSRASEIFKKLTGGKYDNLYIQKDYDFIVGEKTIDRYSRYFSSGTIDQAYLAVRIAVSELIGGTEIPIIFDDTLMQYDDERLKNTIAFLKVYSKEEGIQSVIFTCHEYLNHIICGK